MSKARYLHIFQRNLVRIRKQRGLNQAEAGERIGMKQTQYSKLESSDTDPRLSTIDRLSEALGVPMSALFKDENPQDLATEQVLNRVLELEPSVREPLLQVIEGYLRHHNSSDGVHPQAQERLTKLRAARDEQKSGQ